MWYAVEREKRREEKIGRREKEKNRERKRIDSEEKG
jgi:hypothetical protein